MKLTLKHPLKIFQINQPFGVNFLSFYKDSGMKGHNGIDFYALDATPVYATHDGRVTFTGYDDAGGLGVVIRTEEKFDYYNTSTGALEPSYLKTIYWHLKKDTIKVTGGQQVKAGDLIALSNNTGRSTGPHLHFALKPIYKGEQDWTWYNLEQNNGFFGAIDPMPYFEGTESVEPPKKVYPTVRKGTRGPFVKELQTKLNTQIKAGLVVDGIFGAKTLKAVMDYQKVKGLSIDGICGPKTWAVLNA